MEADLLVLDDLGAEKTSEWVEETMNLVVNTRYNERRPTIFTSNYEDMPDEDGDPESLKARVGFRMHSRLHEMCEFLEYDGADYRHLPPNGGSTNCCRCGSCTRNAAADYPARSRRPSRPSFATVRAREREDSMSALVGGQGRELGMPDVRVRDVELPDAQGKS